MAVKEEVCTLDIYTQLQGAYGDTCTGTSRADERYGMLKMETERGLLFWH